MAFQKTNGSRATEKEKNDGGGCRKWMKA